MGTNKSDVSVETVKSFLSITFSYVSSILISLNWQHIVGRNRNQRTKLNTCTSQQNKKQPKTRNRLPQKITKSEIANKKFP